MGIIRTRIKIRKGWNIQNAQINRNSGTIRRNGTARYTDMVGMTEIIGTFNPSDGFSERSQPLQSIVTLAQIPFLIKTRVMSGAVRSHPFPSGANNDALSEECLVGSFRSSI